MHHLHVLGDPYFLLVCCMLCFVALFAVMSMSPVFMMTEDVNVVHDQFYTPPWLAAQSSAELNYTINYIHVIYGVFLPAHRDWASVEVVLREQIGDLVRCGLAERAWVRLI